MKSIFKRSLSAILAAAIAATSASIMSIGAFATATEAKLTIKPDTTGVNFAITSSDANVTATEGDETADPAVYDTVKITDVDVAATFTLTLPTTCQKYISDAGVANGEVVIASDAKSITVVIPKTTIAASETEADFVINYELVDSIVWVNGKDVKAKAAKGDTLAVPADLNKTDTFKAVNMWAGGTWTPVITAATVNSAAFKTTVSNVVCGNYFDSKGKVLKAVSDATKNTLTAKFSKGAITLTAGKKLSSDTATSEIYRVWIAEVAADKTVTIIDGKVEPFFYDVAVKVAPTALAISTTDNTALAAGETAVVKADKSGLVPVNGETNFYFNPLGIKSGTTYGKVDDSTSYTVKFAKADDADYASIEYKPENNYFTVKGIKTNSGKEYTATVNVTNVQAQKTVKFKVVIANPVVDFAYKNGTTDIADQGATTYTGSTATAAATGSLSVVYTTEETTATATTDKLAVFVLTAAPTTATDFSNVFELKAGKATLKGTKDKDVTAKLSGTTITLTEKKGITTDKVVYVYVVATNKAAVPVVGYAKVTFTAPAAAVTEIATVAPTLTALSAGTYAALTAEKEATAKYTVTSTAFKTSAPADVNVGDTIAAGTYTATIVLTADANCAFKSTIATTDVTLTGYTVTDAAVSKTTNDGDTLTITATITIS